jgi:hypothetical protein
MSSKKKNTASANVQALRIGSRVRCTDDGAEGRIVWANGVSVKVKWDDGEQVTWRRDALAGKPIEVLDAEAASPEDRQGEAPLTASEESSTSELPQAESDTPPAAAEQATATEMPRAGPAPRAQEQTVTTAEPPIAEPVAPAQEPVQAAPADSGSEPTPAPPDKPKRQRKAAAGPKEKKVGALGAAARVLAEENRPMTCKELIEAMAAKGYWASPKGTTPAATLYSAVLRERTTKGSAARFVKTGRGRFARNPGA